MLLVGTSAHAEERRGTLVIPTAVFAATAVADWASTYRAVSSGCNEDNFLINGLQHRPSVMIGVGAGIDVAGAWAWNRFVGRNHPRLAAIGLYTAAAFRGYLVMRNISNATHQRALAAALTGGSPPQ